LTLEVQFDGGNEGSRFGRQKFRFGEFSSALQDSWFLQPMFQT